MSASSPLHLLSPVPLDFDDIPGILSYLGIAPLASVAMPADDETRGRKRSPTPAGPSYSKKNRTCGSQESNPNDGDDAGHEFTGEDNDSGASGLLTRQPRRVWVKDRSHDWWNQVSHPSFPDAEFRRAFRMGRETFEVLCDELSAVVAKENTPLRAAVPVRQRVAVCVWRLATGEPLRLVSRRFGLGISTCHKLVLEVCSAMKSVLIPNMIQWPGGPAASSNVSAKFQSLSNIDNIVGAVYTTHIPIIAPKTNVAAYYNRRHTERNQKTSYSITVQGVVDANGIFTDVFIGWPGSCSDEQILDQSKLNQNGSAGMFNGQWVAGGASYPLTDWLLVPYTHKNLTWAQHAFNEKLGGVTAIAKAAFARFKGRWACLQKRTEVKVDDLPAVLGACCVLHNLCEVRGDGFDPELAFTIHDDEVMPEMTVRSPTAAHARDALAHNLLHGGLAGLPNY